MLIKLVAQLCLYYWRYYVPTPISILDVITTNFSNGLTKRSKIVNGNGTIKSEITFKSGGVGPSTNIQGLLLTFNPIMELFQKLGRNY
jgi:hypothetical protein